MTTKLDLEWLENPGDYIWRDEFHSLIDRMAEMAKTEIALMAKIARLEMRDDPGHTHTSSIEQASLQDLYNRQQWAASQAAPMTMAESYRYQAMLGQQAAPFGVGYCGFGPGGLFR